MSLTRLPKCECVEGFRRALATCVCSTPDAAQAFARARLWCGSRLAPRAFLWALLLKAAFLVRPEEAAERALVAFTLAQVAVFLGSWRMRPFGRERARAQPFPRWPRVPS